MKAVTGTVMRSCAASAFLLMSACAPSAEMDTSAELGRAIYTNCAACHGYAGEGEFGPPLASNPNLDDGDYAISRILSGSKGMPPFDQQLSPSEIAAVVNYVSESWNGGSVNVGAEDVERVADDLK